MKKFLSFFVIVFAICTCCVFCACNPNNEQALANDIDVSVKNFIRTITNMDWPEDADIEKLDTLENDTIIFTEIDTEEIDTWKSELKSKINILLSKRSDLLSASNELTTNNVNLTEELYLSIKVYLDIIKDNSNYLTNYSGIIRNQIKEINELVDANRNINIINAYAIKIVETLCIRCAKIDTTILAMNSIIEIIENNLIDNIYFDKKFVIDDNKFETNDNIEPHQTQNNEQDEPRIDIDNENDIDINIDEQPGENAIRVEPDNVKQTTTEEEPSLENEQNEKTPEL